MELSLQQKEAVEHIGTPALVVAGAGSGKTRTLTAKVSYLVSKGYDPARILAITFTNKAADEMKERLVKLTGMPMENFPWVRTYHSACFKILKRHCSELGYRQPLQIFAEYQQQKVLKDVLTGKLNIDKKYVPAVLNRISRAKNSGRPDAYLDKRPFVAHIRVAEAYALYNQELKNSNAVDFDDILLLTRDLLRDHARIRERYQKLFEFILVDEYQDTNNLQEDLTGLLLRNGNLFCVGDDWQAIYSFRGSNVGHFLSFRSKYKDAKVFRLEQNYRSTNEIVQLANELIGYNDSRMEKQCFSKKQGGQVELYEFDDEKEEAAWTAQRLRALRDEGIFYDKMAVLYRTKFCSLPFEQAFRNQGVPYRMLGGKGFFERKEVLDINCYLTAAVFEKDDAAFERILNIPRRGIGPGTVQKIARLKTDGMSLQEAARQALAVAMLPPRIAGALSAVLRLLDAIRDMRPDLAVQEILKRVDYLEYLKAYSRANSMDYTSREENIEQLIYSASQKDGIVDYLEEAALIKEDKEEEEDDQGFGVNLATIHAAKGLEFQAVFVVGCEENLFPHWKSLESETGLEEERRLMYVAVTRSERHLFLSCAGFRKGQFNPKSRFLEEIERALEH
ncbi:MAG: UvrD-helicase domain-containing protein [Thermodesulfobacteriota bacterium]